MKVVSIAMYSLTYAGPAAAAYFRETDYKGRNPILQLVDSVLLLSWDFPDIVTGALAGLAWHLEPFWIYVCLKLDQIIKAVWCVFRLRSGKWIKNI